MKWMIIPLTLIAAWLISQYLRSIPALIEALERCCPQLWESLGRPRWVFWKHGMKRMYTVSPAFPFLGWLLKGRAGDIDADTEALYRRTRQLLIQSTASIISVLLLLTIALDE